jgi:hypothetical protein|tara:strand:- start:230 stop:1159 length:930 start_codon:yes stop_codon:yes gene_type:complete
MKIQFENSLMSSFLLYVDNKVLKKGSAYTNHSGYFYPVTNSFRDYDVVASPFKQFVYDTSVTGATVMSGIYYDTSTPTSTTFDGRAHNQYKFIKVGTSGFQSISHHEGSVYFDTGNFITNGSYRVSGEYSVKDFNTYITQENEEDLLFETKYYLKPKTNQTMTGLAPDAEPYPAIFLKSIGSVNEPFAFGGLDNTIVTARAVILSDSAYKLDAVCSILRDTARDYVPLMTSEELPFMAHGALTGLEYNYDTLKTNKVTNNSGIYISRVNVSKNVAKQSDMKNVNTNVFTAFVDFEFEHPRYPRTSTAPQ